MAQLVACWFWEPEATGSTPVVPSSVRARSGVRGEEGVEREAEWWAMIESVCLVLFSAGALRSAGLVLMTANPVHSVLFLVLSFVNVSGLMRLMGAEFRAILFMVVYVGAIAVLFLFVVMMLNLSLPMGRGMVTTWRGLGMRVRGIVSAEARRARSSRLSSEETHLDARLREGMATWSRHRGQDRGIDLARLDRVYHDEVVGSSPSAYVDWLALVDGMTNIETLGQVLYTDYGIYVILSGFVLLVAMIGAIVLTLQERTFAVAKRQQAYQQISRDSSRAVMRAK
jgi:NADH-quinone oxidoreductase subunit J